MTSNIQKLLDILLKEDDYSWQELLLELVKQEGMDPWDIDIGILTKRFIEIFKKAKELDFRIPGKVVLACAILLRMQSKQMLEQDIYKLDTIIMNQEPEYEELGEQQVVLESKMPEKPVLIPRIPQPRKRKISVYDLVNALEKALEIEQRRKIRQKKVKIPVPQRKKKMEITTLIKKVYREIKKLAKKKKKVLFNELLPKKEKQDIVYTFLPLLYLETDSKIALNQEEPFKEIEIYLLPNEKQ